MGLCFLWFFIQELPKAQPAVVLVLKRLRRRGNGLKSRPTDREKPGIEPATPGLQDIGLHTILNICNILKVIIENDYKYMIYYYYFCGGGGTILLNQLSLLRTSDK